jgi:hypothetical protein
MPKIPRKCPACNQNLVISRLTCPDCGTEVSGVYPLELRTGDPLSRLPPNDYDFILLFIRTKGNIKEMERELGISYWTIRSKLNDIVAQLGFGADEKEPTDPAIRRQEILEQLNSGLISVDEAAVQLEKIKEMHRR